MISQAISSYFVTQIFCSDIFTKVFEKFTKNNSNDPYNIYNSQFKAYFEDYKKLFFLYI